MTHAHTIGIPRAERDQPSAANSPTVTHPPYRKTGRRFVRTMAPLTLFAALALTACSNNGSDPAEPTTAASSTATPPASSAPPENPTAVAIAKLTGDKTVELTTDTLPKPPTGFTKEEVTAFADRAMDLIERGISPDVTTMSEDAAFKYVFANQYSESSDATRQAFEGIGDYSYAWAVASLFDEPPTEPAKVLAARWQVTTSEGTTADGSTAPILQVALSVAVEHQVADDNAAATSATAPIVMQRTVIIKGFKPLGGEQWWPTIGYQATPLFGGKCAPINGAILTPAHKPTTIREDMARLRKYITKPNAIDVEASEGSDLGEYVQKYCEDK